jgi:nucleoid-associated protein YgaU
MSAKTAALRQNVILAAFQAAGIRDVRIKVDPKGVCHVGGCVSDAAQEALVRRLIENAGVQIVRGKLVHISAASTQVDAKVYRIEEGDSWWRIAERFYGDGAHHVALRDANGNPKDIRPGDMIVIPREI